MKRSAIKLLDAVMPPDRGIWVSFTIPMLVGLSVTPRVGGRTILYITVSLLMLASRSLLLSRSIEHEGPRHRTALALCAAAALACSGWLIVVHSLPVLVPAGILASAVLMMNVRDVRRGWHKRPLRQLGGVIMLTGNVVLLPYVATGEVLADTIAIWGVVFMMFVVSIATMAFKQRLKDHGIGTMGGWERFARSHASLAVIGVAFAVMMSVPGLPAVSFYSTLGFILASILQRWVISPDILIRWKDPIELALLGVWGMGFASGFAL